MLATQETQITETLNAFIAAYLSKDLDKTLDYYADDASTTVVGTGRDEYIVGMDAIRDCYARDFEQSEGKDLELTLISFGQHENVAWVACELKASVELLDGGRFVLDGRMTATLKLVAGDWKIVQSHLSAPMQDQEDGQAFCDNA